MASDSLESWVRSQPDVVDALRQNGRQSSPWSYQFTPPAYTNWFEEQRATVEGCALGDLSHHMTAVHLEGPDAVAFLEDLCINDFQNFPTGRGKQIVMCSPEGYVIGDGPLLRFDEEEFYSAGIFGTKWMQYTLETGDYDVSMEIEPPSRLLPGRTPERYVYQVQGPATETIIDELTDDPFRDIDFFGFDRITLAGHEVIAFGHGMSTEAGYELIGPYDHAEDLRQAFAEAGADHGFRFLGSETYYTQYVKSGWIPVWVKPVYHSDAMQGYREWATGEKERAYGKAYWTEEGTWEETVDIEGSFESEDITDYYFTPVELGYGNLADMDREFVGKAAVEAELEDPRRERVTLFWDNEDVHRVNQSLHGEGEPNLVLSGQYPAISWARQPYDRVVVGDELVGLSLARAYEWDIRGIASQCLIDPAYSEPGTEVTVEWGAPDGTSPIPSMPDHAQTEIAATVRPSPYKPKEK